MRALFIFRERLGWGFWAGLVLALFGAVLILGVDALQAFELGLGSLFGLLAGVFYGAYFLVTQRGREGLNATSFFWLSSAASACVLFLLSLAFGHPLVGYSQQTYLGFVGLGLASQGLGWLAINYAQGHLPATIVAPTLLGQPVVTAVFAGPILGERLGVLHILGGIAVLIGVYMVHRSRSNSILK